MRADGDVHIDMVSWRSLDSHIPAAYPRRKRQLLHVLQQQPLPDRGTIRLTEHLLPRNNQAFINQIVSRAVDYLTSRAKTRKRDACLDRCSRGKQGCSPEQQRWDDHRGHGAHATAQGSRLVPSQPLALGWPAKSTTILRSTLLVSDGSWEQRTNSCESIQAYTKIEVTLDIRLFCSSRVQVCFSRLSQLPRRTHALRSHRVQQGTQSLSGALPVLDGCRQPNHTPLFICRSILESIEQPG
ncbi:hypothetical protein CC86DRAFT_101715 [Ophiobolus disseminans]|uniref:Uncharacterized protein n=1 Tax=Ophiobolus disseminans TaxID=1469910 RepID=A0A6A6ZNQ6_9PLEO|nr:hypothetical protein CC86DRAFT_101715 [Ophiobolus disseminans]